MSYGLPIRAVSSLVTLLLIALYPHNPPAYHSDMPAQSTQIDTNLKRIRPTAHGDLVFGARTLIMGILNATPDSFSDGGRDLNPEPAVRRIEEMATEAADLIDIGGESTRPGARPVSPDEQIERVVPIIREARNRGVSLPISIDTRSAKVAEAALDAGADVVNDISAARADAAMPRLLAERDVPFVAMHMQGTPETMQDAPHYDNVVADVAAFFDERAETLAAAGVNVTERMVVDPGIGFGKTTSHNLMLLRSAATFGRRWPVVIGPSRKRFLGEILNEPDPARRLIGTAAAVAHAALTGADMVRVHDVGAMRQVVEVCGRIVAC